jgi:hypothetical protein
MSPTSGIRGGGRRAEGRPRVVAFPLSARAPELPGIVTRAYGKGRVVYMAAGFDAGDYLYAYPYERLILRNAIEWVAPSPAPVVVEAPMCVHSPVMRRSRGGPDLHAATPFGSPTRTFAKWLGHRSFERRTISTRADSSSWTDVSRAW